MNSMIVTIDEDCNEVKITTGITTQGEGVQGVYKALGVELGVWSDTLSLVLDSDVDWGVGINIDECCAPVLVVGGDPDERVTVCIYNASGMSTNALVYLMVALTNFKA